LKTEFKLGCFVLTFQMRTVVSLEPDAKSSPSAQNETMLIVS
jgi:hypothetical protein